MAISFTWLKKNELFSCAMRKMSLNIKLDDHELEFMLTCAIVFFKEYNGDKRKSPYFEIAYYITLKCAINNDFYDPLLDASSNFGLYPISRFIIKNIAPDEGVSNTFSLDYQLTKFEYKDIVETYEQRKCREEIVNSEEEENCYVAPTSFGKSSLIVEIIATQPFNTVAIIVPTKSLLIQTYKLLKKSFPLEHLIFHDEMYDGSDRFISVFTQERALRLLKDRKLSFDILIIDEAHNLFDKGSRSLLLSRLIRRNRHRNPKSKNYYLSPLISETNNLKLMEGQNIFESRIFNNIKEPDISEYRENGNVYNYNRFLDDFYLSGKSEGFTQYIVSNSKNKNFIYLRAPRKVEQFALLLEKELEELNSENLSKLSSVISQNVHSDFYCVDYVKKGLVYLHGKLPDLIKEYLEHKFTRTDEMKYVVANSVILEGVNLPVDNLYILNTNSLGVKLLTNLIGRVNRLNEVFNENNKTLSKLLPSIHFVNSEDFNRKGGKMENQIRSLKSGVFKDSIKNPILINFDPEKLERDLEQAKNERDLSEIDKIENDLSTLEQIILKEDFLIFNEDDETTHVKRVLMESALSSLYTNPNLIFKKLEQKIDELLNDDNWLSFSVIDKIYLFFIKDFEDDLTNAEFSRLKHPKARTYYEMFTNNLHRFNLKEHISETVRYFHQIKNENSGRKFFIGSSYGEKPWDEDSGLGKKVYIDLSEKTNKELVNIALVKIKIESDFVSYTLNEYVNVLFELDLITEKEYEMQIYGTTNKINSEFVKIGLSGSLINKLDHDGQLKYLNINEFGAIEFDTEFKTYLAQQDDLIQFEVSKYIDI